MDGVLSSSEEKIAHADFKGLNPLRVDSGHSEFQITLVMESKRSLVSTIGAESSMFTVSHSAEVSDMVLQQSIS
jgi:hypothetical protein